MQLDTGIFMQLILSKLMDSECHEPFSTINDSAAELRIYDYFYALMINLIIRRILQIFSVIK